MKPLPRLACAAALPLSILLAGCSYFLPTKRHLPVPRTPEAVQTVSSDDLVKQLNDRWESLNSLTATAEIQATQEKSDTGIATDFPSFRSFIIMQKPSKLHVVGQFFGKGIFDMVSDGNRFTIVMPTRNTVVEGTNDMHEKSANSLENLRPDFFLDAIVIRGLDADDEFMVASDTETVADAANKHLFIEPEYILSVMRRKTGHEIQPVRTITFHRDDMLPYDQYVYDKNGALETQIFYSNYQTFSAGKYPSKVVIKRPQEGITLVLSVIQVHQNVDLTADQFEVKIPEGSTIKTLK
jgi:outer membrane lipoprotein-sorting protein